MNQADLFVRSQIGQIQAQLGQVLARTNQVQTQVGQVLARVDQVESRVSQVLARVDQVESRVSQVQTRVDQNVTSRTTSASVSKTDSSDRPVRYVGYIAGFRFHDGPTLLKKLHPGMVLRVVRQPHNPHDPDAIQLFIGPHLLGYVPRGPNRELARRLDKAEPLICRISSIQRDEVPWHQVEICIESLSVATPSWGETDPDEFSARPIKFSRSDDFSLIRASRRVSYPVGK